eukprot:TRINITY_DN1335_c0_g1_i1.p1 TRINITY_DN1335_c0_g1~~TRINITY_DN1335_c0_g1_i1.p1  ORF type:complete len:867 (-),score=151.57 TRINITY_DN1335_c0_g1_i1:2032-4632(-)
MGNGNGKTRHIDPDGVKPANESEDRVFFTNRNADELPPTLLHKRITSLDVSFNRLTSLPVQMGQLRNLRVLRMQSNSMRIFPQILSERQLPLEHLVMDRNQLLTLPDSVSTFPTLIQLHLSKNRISRVSSLVGMLAKLELLDLSSNNITVLPDSFGGLVSLQVLRLACNGLTELPAALGSCTSLQVLQVQGNKLTALPNLGTCTGLVSLNLSQNFISTLPPSLFPPLTALRSLHLDRNKLIQLPMTIGSLQSLKELTARGNMLSIVPASLGLLMELKILDLAENSITTLPQACFAKLYQLERLELQHNKLTEFTPDLTGLLVLGALNLSENPITLVSEELFRLRSLERVIMFNCGVNEIAHTGTTAHSEASTRELYLTAGSGLSDLQGLFKDSWLRLCSISGATFGKVPEELLTCQHLEKLRLPSCGIQVFSPDLANLRLLDELSLNCNPLVDDIPDLIFLKSLQKLRILQMSSCNIGQIPAALVECANLQQLDLSFNHISDLPSDVFHSWKHLEFLDLSNNQLTILPADGLEEMHELKQLNVSNNLLKALPVDELAGLGLEVLCVDGNQLVSVPQLVCAVINADVNSKPFQQRPQPTAADRVVPTGHISFIQPSKRYDIGYSMTMGQRPYMEDGIAIHGALCGDSVDYIALFDGHAGAGAMQIAVSRMHEDIATRLSMMGTDQAAEALLESMAAVNKCIVERTEAGAVALVALVIGAKLYVASLGDSRAVLYKTKGYTRLTTDHKATDENEANLVRERGGFVTDDGRLCGVLAVSRALGDRELLPFVGTHPDISVFDLTSDCEGVVLGCDGVWDVLTDEQAANVVRGKATARIAAHDLRDAAMLNRSADNVSVVVLRFAPPIDQK